MWHWYFKYEFSNLLNYLLGWCNKCEEGCKMAKRKRVGHNGTKCFSHGNLSGLDLGVWVGLCESLYKQNWSSFASHSSPEEPLFIIFVHYILFDQISTGSSPVNINLARKPNQVCWEGNWSVSGCKVCNFLWFLHDLACGKFGFVPENSGFCSGLFYAHFVFPVCHWVSFVLIWKRCACFVSL